MTTGGGEGELATNGEAPGELAAEGNGEGELATEGTLAREGGSADKSEDTGVGVLLASIVGFFVVMIFAFFVDFVLIKGMLARRGANLLASYTAVNEVFAFALALNGFVMIGALAVLSRTSGEGDDAASGKVMRQSLAMALVCGVISSVLLAAAHRPLLELFKPRDKDESLVAGAYPMLLIQACFFVGPCLLLTVTSIVVAILQLYTVVVAIFVTYTAWVIVALTLYHQTSLGLASFGIAVSISYAGYVLVCERTAGGRARYGLDESYFEKVTVSDLKAFSGEIGYVGFRSVFSTVRALLTPLYAIRLGVVEGAVYALLLSLQGPAVLLATASSALNFLGARMIGAGEAKAFTYFCKHCTIALTLLCGVVCVLYALAGRGVVVDRAKDSERGEYRDILEPGLWVLAIAILPMRLLSTVVDNVLLATQDFKAMAAAYALSFAAYALALAIAFSSFRTLFALYVADFIFFAVRLVSSGAYLYFETFTRKAWIVGVPVDDSYAVYRAEAVALLDAFKVPCFKCFILALPAVWHTILIGIYRSMVQDLRQASRAVSDIKRGTLKRKVEPYG